MNNQKLPQTVVGVLVFKDGLEAIATNKFYFGNFT